MTKTKVKFNSLTISDAFKQLVCRQRMAELREANVHDLRTSKFTRQHVVNFYDALHRHKSFEAITIDDFPERRIPRTIQYKKQAKVDINNDSDASLGEEEMYELSDDDLDITADVATNSPCEAIMEDDDAT